MGLPCGGTRHSSGKPSSDNAPRATFGRSSPEYPDPGFLVRIGSNWPSLRLVRMMLRTTLLVFTSLLVAVPAQAQRPPRLVPKGWIQELADPETKTRRFASPDGRAWLITKQTMADPSALDQDMDDVAYRDDEKITYQKRGRSWIAVSGYWGDQIFYRKSNLACGGTRWHHIELGTRAKIKRRWMQRSPEWRTA